MKELTISTYPLFDAKLKLPVPRTRDGYDVKRETWTVNPERLGIVVDMTPRFTTLAGAESSDGVLGASTRIEFDESTMALIDLNDLYCRLLQHKSARSYDNFFIPRSVLATILETCEVRVSGRDANHPDVIADAAARALYAYLDRYVSRCERRAESEHLEPGYLLAKEQPIEYRVRTSSESLLKDVEELIAKGEAGLKTNCTLRPIPRLHLDRHLYSPLLLESQDELKVSPPDLLENEKKLIESIYTFWASHRSDPEMKSLEIFILRNLPKVGIGFFRQSGFYPDFMLWIRDRGTKATHLRFLESHGMHHDGLSGINRSKIECLKELAALSRRKEFYGKNFTLDGFILTSTKKEKIPGAQDKTWDQLRRDDCLLNEDGLDPGILLRVDR